MKLFKPPAPKSAKIPPISFKYEAVASRMFGTLYRPVVKVQFWSEATQSWKTVQMLVDTGADYSILPRYLATWLQLEIKDTGKVHETQGVGGVQKIYMVDKLRARIGKFEREVPVGIIDSTQVPPLMGRLGFFETFEAEFSRQRRITFGE